MKHSLLTKVASAAVLGGLTLAGGGVALAATVVTPSTGTATSTSTATSTGTVRLYATDNNGAARSPIMFTGAVGDFGTALSIDSSGKPDPDGDAVEVHLRHGSFRLDLTPLNQASQSDHFHADQATCSGWVSTIATLPVLRGAGGYRGIHGSIRVTDTYAVVAPRISSGAHKGQCSRNARPLSQFESITGVGRVTMP